MSVRQIEGATAFRTLAKVLRSGLMSSTPNEKRDAQVMAALMDHSSIRALVSAFPHFFAGLPRSDIGDHHGGCSLKTFEDSPRH